MTTEQIEQIKEGKHKGLNISLNLGPSWETITVRINDRAIMSGYTNKANLTVDQIYNYVTKYIDEQVDTDEKLTELKEGKLEIESGLADYIYSEELTSKLEAADASFSELTEEFANIEEVKDPTEELQKSKTSLATLPGYVYDEKALTETEKNDVINTFKEAKDFRQLGEMITAPIDNIISQTAHIIEADPIMTVSDELAKVNGWVQEVYKEIIDNDSKPVKVLKKIPLIGGIVKAIDNQVDKVSFDLKPVEKKITTIFSGFDQSMNSLDTSIDMQKSFLEGLDQNINKVAAYSHFVGEKLQEFESKMLTAPNEHEKIKYEMFARHVQFFQNNLVTLVGNLDMSRKRLLIRLDAASKLSLAMSSSRPIFKTLLSTAMIETSSQKALDASIDAINIMWSTIDKMSTELTNKAIESSRKSEELSSKPVLSAQTFVDNVAKLKNHFDTIEEHRKLVRAQADEQKKLFDSASQSLKEIKLIEAKGHEELSSELLSWK